MLNFGRSTTTASNTFGTTTSSTGSLFSGGDASKAMQPATAGAGQDKQNIFGSTTFGNISFGAKTTTSASTNLFTPATTSSALTFGANKPLSFDFGSPPNQTVGSPGFGAAQQQQQAPQPLTFGTPTQQQQQPAPAFGAPAQTTSSSMPFSSPSFTFKPATPGGFAFTTPTSGFSAPQLAATATTSTAPQTTQSFFSVASTTSTGLGSAPATAAVSFGQSNFGGGGFAFGASTASTASVTAPTSSSTLSAATPPSSNTFTAPTNQNTPALPSFSYGQSSLGFTQPQATTTNPPTALNLASTTSSGFNFAPKASLSFPSATTQASLGTSAPISLGTSAPISLGTSAPLSLGTTAPTLSLGTIAATQPTLSLGSATSQPALSLGTTTSLSAGLSFPKPTTTAVISSIASTTAPAGITAFGKTTATTTMASLTTATTTTAAAPPQAITSLTFAQLEENINKWTQELEEQEKTFINQATQLNAWDRLVIANGEKIVELNDAVETVKNEQESLEHEIGFVLAQQKELEDLLTPMEKQLLEDTGDRLRDPEREHMYFLAENLERQMRQMSEDLKEVIEHLNETNRSQDSNDPIVQIGRILNAHMSSMQWIDNSIAQISTKLDQLKATHDTLRRDNERSFQKTYN